jgi:LPXTG-motif cell wall-anchored protein
VRISFDDGEVSTTLTIQNNEVPDTGDESRLVLWSGVMLASLAAMMLIRAGKKREAFMN